MKYSKKQKIFTIIGLITILLTPLIVLLGGHPLATLLCSKNETLQTVCIGVAAPMAWGILILGTLLIGSILILIGSLIKNRK